MRRLGMVPQARSRAGEARRGHSWPIACRSIAGSQDHADPAQHLDAHRQAKAWLRRYISDVENQLLFGAPPADTPPVKGFATAAADYIERGGKHGPLGKNDIAKLTALIDFLISA